MKQRVETNQTSVIERESLTDMPYDVLIQKDIIGTDRKDLSPEQDYIMKNQVFSLDGNTQRFHCLTHESIKTTLKKLPSSQGKELLTLIHTVAKKSLSEISSHQIFWIDRNYFIITASRVTNELLLHDGAMLLGFYTDKEPNVYCFKDVYFLINGQCQLTQLDEKTIRTQKLTLPQSTIGFSVSLAGYFPFGDAPEDIYALRQEINILTENMRDTRDEINELYSEEESTGSSLELHEKEQEQLLQQIQQWYETGKNSQFSMARHLLQLRKVGNYPSPATGLAHVRFQDISDQFSPEEILNNTLDIFLKPHFKYSSTPVVFVNFIDWSSVHSEWQQQCIRHMTNYAETVVSGVYIKHIDIVIRDTNGEKTAFYPLFEQYYADACFMHMEEQSPKPATFSVFFARPYTAKATKIDQHPTQPTIVDCRLMDLDIFMNCRDASISPSIYRKRFQDNFEQYFDQVIMLCNHSTQTSPEYDYRTCTASDIQEDILSLGLSNVIIQVTGSLHGKAFEVVDKAMSNVRACGYGNICLQLVPEGYLTDSNQIEVLFDIDRYPAYRFTVEDLKKSTISIVQRVTLAILDLYENHHPRLKTLFYACKKNKGEKENMKAPLIACSEKSVKSWQEARAELPNYEITKDYFIKKLPSVECFVTKALKEQEIKANVDV